MDRRSGLKDNGVFRMLHGADRCQKFVTPDEYAVV